MDHNSVFSNDPTFSDNDVIRELNLPPPMPDRLEFQLWPVKDEPWEEPEFLEGCDCGQCVKWETPAENTCCRHIPAVDRIRQESGEKKGLEYSCITETDQFQLNCLREEVLTVAYVHYVRPGAVYSIQLDNLYRYTSYHQFVVMVWGKLRRYDRRPLPSCAYRHVRKKFRSPDGSYTGFREATR